MVGKMERNAPVKVPHWQGWQDSLRRRRGRQCKIATERFGEKVWYKELKSKTEAQDKGETAWAEGLWLGHARSSNEVLIGTRDGVVRAWAVRRRDPQDRWDSKLIQDMKGTPQQPNPNKPGTMIPIKINFDEMPKHENINLQPARTEDGPRSMFIQGWELKQYGYTEGCKGCEHKRAGMESQRPHTQACRTRMEAAVEQDARGRAAKNRTEERFHHWEKMKRKKAEDADDNAEVTNDDEDTKDSAKDAKNAKDADDFKDAEFTKDAEGAKNAEDFRDAEFTKDDKDVDERADFS